MGAAAAAAAVTAGAAAVGGGDRPWRDRGTGGGSAGAEDLRQHGRDGSFKSRIRIVDMSKGRDDREDEGEKEKRSSSDRLDRLGY